MRVTPLFTLLRGLPAKGRIHLILLDPRPRVAALSAWSDTDTLIPESIGGKIGHMRSRRPTN
jgi:hypothetical protein